MTRPRIALVVFLALSLASAPSSAAQDADPGSEPDDRIGLADLAAYRASLSGRATADDARPSDPPARVGFRDLWERPEAFRGRRVTIRGRLERTFRQGAIGSFPPLVESWVFSPTGDPFCVVYPQTEAAGRGGTAGGSLVGPADDRSRDSRAEASGEPRPGQMIRFTGTFLKTVRYPARDGERMAPLIVGDRQPDPQSVVGVHGEPVKPSTSAGEVLRAIGGVEHEGRPGTSRRVGAPGDWFLGLGLAAMAALVIAGQHLRGAQLRYRPARRPRLADNDRADPPLHFVDTPRDV
jgi:hypothetical protein